MPPHHEPTCRTIRIRIRVFPLRRRPQRGAASAEMGLLVALVSAAAITAVVGLGPNLQHLFCSVQMFCSNSSGPVPPSPSESGPTGGPTGTSDVATSGGPTPTGGTSTHSASATSSSGSASCSATSAAGSGEPSCPSDLSSDTPSATTSF
jgi:Flp pilus assembly pilin Flp